MLRGMVCDADAVLGAFFFILPQKVRRTCSFDFSFFKVACRDVFLSELQSPRSRSRAMFFQRSVHLVFHRDLVSSIN